MQPSPKLKRYLQSLGAEIPETSNPKDCVFCDLPHDSLGVFQYDPVTGENKLIENKFACTECASEIDFMVYARYRYENEPQNVLDTAKQDRLRLFKNYLGFEDNVENHIIHYSSKADGFITNGYRNTCYFCKHTVSTSNPKRIPIPVQFSVHIKGGNIRVCESCFLEIKADLYNLYEEHAHPQICPDCNRTYHLTSQEFNYRMGGESLGQHLCPECTYNQISKLSSKDIRYIVANTGVRTEGIERFAVVNCGSCNQAFDVDVTLQKSVLEARHRRSANKFLCTNCSKSMVQSYVYNYGSNIRITFFFTDKSAKYVVKINNSSEEILKSPDYPKNTDIAELLFTAIVATDEFLVGRQLLLPFEDTYEY